MDIQRGKLSREKFLIKIDFAAQILEARISGVEANQQFNNYTAVVFYNSTYSKPIFNLGLFVAI